MGSLDSIRESLLELKKITTTDVQENQYLLIGRIAYISSDKKTCSVQPVDETKNPVYNISTGFPSYTPTIGAFVTVHLYSASSGYIAEHGSVSKATVAAGTTDYGGFIIVQNATDKLNNLENKVNAIVDWLVDFVGQYNGHVHSTTCGAGVGTAAPTGSLETKTNEPHLTTTQVSDLENVATSHGNGVADDAVYIAKLTQLKLELAALNRQLAALNATKLNATKSQVTNVQAKEIEIEQKIIDKQVEISELNKTH